MKPPFPSYTQEWHTDTYEAINPKRSELSLKGKKVVITGGGAGIGRTITQAFALAGAATIAILGRTATKLEETKQAVEKTNGDVKITTHVVDVVDTDAAKHAAAGIGAWDVIVSCAGYLPEMVPVVDADVNEWWRGWEVRGPLRASWNYMLTAFKVNVKGSFNICHAFLPTRSKNATIVSVSAGSAHIDVSRQANGSSYNASKLGAIKFFEIVSTENPDIHVVNMHPGVGKSCQAQQLY